MTYTEYISSGRLSNKIRNLHSQRHELKKFLKGYPSIRLKSKKKARLSLERVDKWLKELNLTKKENQTTNNHYN